ncbi:acryloyl-CoA reductase [Arcanobacterium haemolyticum]|nr:acryloyl-CoA reductase [Arcanobacterium haemolyticum]
MFRAYELRDTDEGVRGHLTHLTPESLGEGDVLVRVSHSSVNFKDGLAATGRAPIARSLPLIGGCNASGIVVDPGSSDLRVGQSVTVIGASLSEKHPGGYAEFMRVPSSWITPLPESISAWTSMAVGTAGLTAAMAIRKLELAGLHPDQGPVAVTGASGGAGTLAVAMLAARGYKVTAVTGTPEAEGLLRELGAHDIQPRPDLSGKPRALDHAHWAGAVDTVGGDTLAWLVRTTLPGGSVAAFGNAGGNALATTVMPFILRGVNLLGVTVSFPSIEVRDEAWAIVSSSLSDEVLHKVTRTISFDELDASLKAIVDNEIVGRVVVEIP